MEKCCEPEMNRNYVLHKALPTSMLFFVMLNNTASANIFGTGSSSVGEDFDLGPPNLLYFAVLYHLVV
jgi:hypothetical protein